MGFRDRHADPVGGVPVSFTITMCDFAVSWRGRFLLVFVASLVLGGVWTVKWGQRTVFLFLRQYWGYFRQ